MKTQIESNQFQFSNSSFIKSIRINDNHLEVSMKHTPTIYTYEIIRYNEIPQIKMIWMNQDSLSIGKFFNYLRYSKHIELIDKSI